MAKTMHLHQLRNVPDESIVLEQVSGADNF